MKYNKTAVITGITGQDGSYLAEFLLKKDYNVIGIVRRLSKPNLDNITNIIEKIKLEEGDLHDQSSLNRIMRKYRPDEVYNLAAQTFVGASWNQPVLTGDVTGLGALRVFESIRLESPDSRVYQAGSSEMFGKIKETPQNEDTSFHPRSPYGCAKAYAHHLAVNYRESYNIFISNGILFNHESPRRGIEFVTKKIANGVARIAKGVQKNPIQLGNISAMRDWGYAPEYVDAMWRMLQQKEPDDFVVATGETHTVQEFIESAFSTAMGVEYIDEMLYKKYISINIQENIRPAEVQFLCGSSLKAKTILGWEAKIKFHELVKIMVEDELKRIKT